ncbi:MAG: cytoplasmic protein [Methylobacteriaceae bacterium]|nr:cytoplasmic protein [Methylobacteriaceae bacterium]
MPRTKILLAGESWVSAATHYKGFDQFGSVTFHLGAEPLVAALADSEFELVYMPAHEAVQAFPFTLEGLDEYGAVILSDIGSNSLLLPQEVWLHGRTMPNRLRLMRDWTHKGGGLVMVGGYFSFQGIDGRARWHRTPVEEALPVECLPYDDRVEMPEGMKAEILAAGHPILAGLGRDWPPLLGANEVVARTRPGVEVLARIPAEQGGHPLLIAGTFGEGRSVAWTSDIGPHWLPATFSNWPGYATLWRNVLAWVTGGR